MSQLTTEDIRPDCCIEYYVVCGGFTEPHGAIVRRDRTGVLPPPDSLDANWNPVPAWCNLCCYYADAAGDEPMTNSPNQVIYYLSFLNESKNAVAFGGIEQMWAVCDGQGNWWFNKFGYGQDGCVVVGSFSYLFQMSVNGGFDFWSNDTSYGALTFNAIASFGNWWNYWAECDFWYWGEFTALHSWRLDDYQCNIDGFRATWIIPKGFPVFGELSENGQNFIGAGVRYFRVEAAAAPTLATKCHTITVHGCGNNTPLPGAIYDIYSQSWNGSSFDYTLVAEGTADYGGIVQWDTSVGYGFGPIGSGGPPPNRLYRTINIPYGTAGYGRFQPQVIGVGTLHPYTGYYQPQIDYTNIPATGYVCNYISYYAATPYPLFQYMNWTIVDTSTGVVLWSSADFGQLYSAYGFNWLLEFDFLFEGCPAAGCPDPQMVHVIMTMNPNNYPYGSVYIQFQFTSPYNFCPDPSYTGYAYLIFQSLTITDGLPFMMQGLTADYSPGGIGMFCSKGPLLFTATEAL